MYTYDPLANSFWIVRGAHERTTECCRALIAEFVPEDRITTLVERPFTRAVRRTYEIGIERGLKWTVCIDADVFVYAEGFRHLLAIADAQPDEVYVVQGFTIDKFIPIIRTAGTGVYRTALLPTALRHIPQDPATLRPEGTARQLMTNRGHYLFRAPVVVGMHDFEQAYPDIVRKAFLHTRKHANVRREMSNYWSAHQHNDPDFRAALLGMELSDTTLGPLTVDREFMRREYAAALERAGLAAKAPLRAGAITAEYVSGFVTSFRPDPEIQELKYPRYNRFERHQPQPYPIRKWVKGRRRALGQLARRIGLRG